VKLACGRDNVGFNLIGADAATMIQQIDQSGFAKLFVVG